MKKQQKESKDILEDPALDITSDFSLSSMQLKDQRWYARLFIASILPRAYHVYKVSIFLNEEPYLERISEIENSLNDTLFKNDPGEVKSVNKRIKEQRDQLERLRNDCETFEFSASVQELKYKDEGTVVILRIPDDVIEPFNRQKSRMNIYHVTLSPVGI